jgi:predicted metal-binding membrane protein
MSRKMVLAGVLVLAWATTLAAVNVLLAPATGAATVLQMHASDASYLASMSLVAGAPMASIVITVLFGIAMYWTIHSEK